MTMDAEKRFIVQSNWKMNKTRQECIRYIGALRALEDACRKYIEIILCVPFTLLRTAADEAMGSAMISTGAQNVYWEERGAFTGEISPLMLSDAGTRYCVVGHSERRDRFRETDEDVRKKTKALLDHGIRPIVCIGESMAERQRGLTFNRMEYQFRTCFQGLTAPEMERVVILYEPVWAIGTGHVATPEQAGKAHGFIRDLLKTAFSEETAGRTRIIYGGSVKVENVSEMLSADETDGVGVGSGSWNVQDFLRIVETCLHLKTGE